MCRAPSTGPGGAPGGSHGPWWSARREPRALLPLSARQRGLPRLGAAGYPPSRSKTSKPLLSLSSSMALQDTRGAGGRGRGREGCAGLGEGSLWGLASDAGSERAGGMERGGSVGGGLWLRGWMRRALCWGGGRWWGWHQGVSLLPGPGCSHVLLAMEYRGPSQALAGPEIWVQPRLRPVLSALQDPTISDLSVTSHLRLAGGLPPRCAPAVPPRCAPAMLPRLPLRCRPGVSEWFPFWDLMVSKRRGRGRGRSRGPNPGAEGRGP